MIDFEDYLQSSEGEHVIFANKEEAERYIETYTFDYSNNGFYIVTEKSAKEYCLTTKKIEAIKTLIESEIDLYNRFVNGEIYCWTLYNEQGEVEDSGSDYYDLEDIKAELPKEWKNEDLSKYVI
jgi:hypothetical protein